jgi:hypothetical protein
MAEAEAEKKYIYKIPQGLFKEQGAVMMEYSITPPSDVPYKALFEPSAWVHNAKYLRKQMFVHVLPQDDSYYALLRVVECGPLWAKMHQVIFDPTPEVDPKSEVVWPAEFEIAWKGPARMFAVVRKSDNQVMQDKFQTKAAAHGWLAENGKGMAA